MHQEDVNVSKQPANYQILIPQEYYGGHQDDEISLVDLFLTLWRKKIWIMGLSGFITLVSIFYAFSLQPVYQAKAYLLPPLSKDIAVLNSFSGNASHTSSSVYKQALDNLKSRQHRWMFFNQYKLLKLYVKEPDPIVRPRNIFNKSFYNSLSVENQAGEQTVTYFYRDKQRVARVLNQFVTFINDVTIKGIVNDIHGAVQFEEQQIKQKIEQLRQDALLQRQDKIQQIREQIKIARKLNIHTNKLVNGALESTDGEQPPYYYLEGTKALQVKMDALTNRKSDDPYISQLRPLQARLAVLDKARIDVSQVRAFSIDQEALEPKHPIKPKKRQIVVLGFILGVMLSIFAVFVWHFIEKYRQEHVVRPQT